MDRKVLIIPGILLALWAVFHSANRIMAKDVIPAGVFAPTPEEGDPPRVRVIPAGHPGLMDIDNDGYVTDFDLRLALDHWQGIKTLTPAQVARGDYDGDGMLGMLDVLGISNYLMYGQYNG